MKHIKIFSCLLKPYKRKIFFAFISILLVNLSSLVFPWAIKIIIDDVVINKKSFLLNALCGGLVLIFFVKFYFGYIYEYLIAVVGENVVCDLRGKLYRHLQKLSVPYVDDTSTGEIISRIVGDTESIQTFLSSGIIDFIYSFFSMFFILAVLCVMDWRLTLVSLVFLPVFGITFLKFTPRLREKHRVVREKYGELTGRLSEVFGAMRIVAGFVRERYESHKFSLKQKEIVKTSIESQKLEILLWMGSELVSSLGLVTLVWFGARAVFSGRITIGVLMAFYSYLGMLFVPLVRMISVNNYYQEAVASMERVSDILTKEPSIKEVTHPVALDRIKGDVRFRRVGFSYDGTKKALSEIDFDIKASEVVALVGKSGAGKTTLINLLLRFYDPVEGEILIDGYPLKDVQLKSYRSNISMVFQDDYIFDTSIKSNILYGRPGASMDDVVRVAEAAGAHQFITGLTDGYNTEVVEKGIKLSYGQRQRISIARAILRDSAILVLDEATSCVDSETERRIIERAYKRLVNGRTTFIIAHRLSAITYADRILFIEDGRITEEGSHSELLNKKGSYWRMWAEQYVDIFEQDASF